MPELKSGNQNSIKDILEDLPVANPLVFASATPMKAKIVKMAIKLFFNIVAVLWLCCVMITSLSD